MTKTKAKDAIVAPGLKVVNVVIRPRPEERGGRWVEVNERAWGTIHMTQHGSQGNKFHFRQTDGETIMIPLERPTVTRKFTSFEVLGDKMARRRAEYERKPGQLIAAPPAPVEERLLEAAKKLIAEGRLIHPDEVAKRREAAQATMKASADRARAAEDRKFRERAKQAIGTMGFESESQMDRLVDSIVAAMKWAQSQ